MKNKVERRLQEILLTSEQDLSVEDQLNLEMKRLSAYVDAVKNNEFGFVSHFKGSCAEFYHGWYRTVLTPKETKHKVEQIQKEYNSALNIAPTIDKILELLTQWQDEQLFFSMSAEEVLNKVTKTLRWLSATSDKALNGCIEKGYNVPAMEILSRFCVCDESRLDLPAKAEEDVIACLKGITSSYAKKQIYKDNAHYLKVNRNKETQFKCLEDAIKTNKFGVIYGGVAEMRRHFEHVVNSSWDSPTAKCLSNIENI